MLFNTKKIIEYFQSLNKLDEEVYWDMFLGLSSLKVINLWSNMLNGTVDWSIFSSMNNLNTLDLRDNQFNGTINLNPFKNMINIGSIFLTSNNWDETSTKLDFTHFLGNPGIRIDPQYLCDDATYCDVSNGFYSITRITATNNECFPNGAKDLPTTCSCTCQCTNGNGISFTSPLCFGSTLNPTGKPSQTPTNYPSQTPTIYPSSIPTIIQSITPTTNITKSNINMTPDNQSMKPVLVLLIVGISIFVILTVLLYCFTKIYYNRRTNISDIKGDVIKSHENNNAELPEPVILRKIETAVQSEFELPKDDIHAGEINPINQNNPDNIPINAGEGNIDDY